MSVYFVSIGKSLSWRFSLVLLLLLLLAVAPLASAQDAGTTLSAAVTDTGIPTLVGPDGRTLYWFAHDHEGEPTCYGPCAEEWPPLTLDGGTEPGVGEGVPGQVGTAERDDGSVQVTYNGWPLYYYHEDTAPGQANGHGAEDVWFAMPPATIALSTAGDMGSYLISASGLTLYIFTQDEANESYCFEECAVAWPPLIVPEGATPTAGAGLTGTLGTTEREDGSLQVTYNGWPLYFFKGDWMPGDTTGHGLKDVWFVAVPAELEAGMPSEGEGDESAGAEATESGADTSQESGGDDSQETGGESEPAEPATTPEASD